MILKIKKRVLLGLLSSFLFSVSYSQTVCEVKEALEKYEVKHTDIVLQQSILETGWFKSYSCRERNNLFGFRYKGEYLKFDTWEESVAYYAKWQKRHLTDDCCDYYVFLECLYKNKRGECIRYAGDPNYINKLKSIKV